VVVTVVVAVGILAIIAAVAVRVQRAKRIRAARAKAHRDLGIRLVNDVHALGVSYFEQGKQKLDRTRWDPFLAETELVDAILIEMDDFEPTFVDAARFAKPRIEEFQGTLQELGATVKMTRGRITSGATRHNVWIFQMPIMNNKGIRIGKAMVCLKALPED
jgi:hypothetical protein